jgi:hypothetical protein
MNYFQERRIHMERILMRVEVNCQFEHHKQDGELWSLSWETDPDLSIQHRKKSQAKNYDSEIETTADNMNESQDSALALKDLFEGPKDNDNDHQLWDAFLSKVIPLKSQPKIPANRHNEWDRLINETIAPSVVDPEAVLQNMLDILCEHPAEFSRYAAVIDKYGQANIKLHLKRCARGQMQEVCTKAPWNIQE